MYNKKENPLNMLRAVKQKNQNLEINDSIISTKDTESEVKTKKTRTVKKSVSKKENNDAESAQTEETLFVKGQKTESKSKNFKAAKNNKNSSESVSGKAANKSTKAVEEKEAKLNADKEKKTKKTSSGKRKSIVVEGLGKSIEIEDRPSNLPSLEEQILNILKEKENKSRKKKSKAAKKVKIIPLGGLEQIGMNITAFEYEDSIFVVDCGLAFPSEDMLGIDLVIPDVSYLKDNFAKVKGFVITHGHEDHIGALPYILKQLNVPVYGTRLTLALIERKLKEHGIDKSAKLNLVKHGQIVKLGAFEVEFIRTNHSILDASALAINTPNGVIFHTGDFKIDYTPVFGEPADLQRMAEIGKKGCLALICESTNATRPGFTMSERTVGRTFDIIFSEHQKSRIIVATFASNVDRVQQVINTANKYGRKVVVEGRSMVNVIGTADELGYINIPKGTLIDIDNLKDYNPEDTVIITTGSQGESMAALSRMSSSAHRKVSITPSDVVIMSSTPIPGNEKAVAKVINELSMKGAEVIFQDTHVSGHACQEEIKLMYSLLRPKYSLPIHGEYRHRMAQSEIAQAMGVPKENILIVSSGDVIELEENSCKVNGHVDAGGIYVDGLGVGDVGNIVLRDRQNLSQNGIIVIAMSLERGTNKLLSGPDIVSRGFVYVRESEDLMDEASNVVKEALYECLDARINDWSKIKNHLRDALGDFLWKRIKRNPVILPIIMEVQ